MRLLLIACLAAGFLLQISSPVHGEIPGDGRPVNISTCGDIAGAQAYATALTNEKPHYPPGCVQVKFYYPPAKFLRITPILIGPLIDWEGDTFAVFDVALPNGVSIYPFIWWAPGYSPIGMRI